MKRMRIYTKGVAALALGASLALLVAIPASAGSVAVSAGITGNGTIYHATGHPHLTGGLGLTAKTSSGGCGSSTGISLRGQVGAAAAVTQSTSFYTASVSFRNLSAPPVAAYTFGAGTKWFTTSQAGAESDCYAGWAGTFGFVG